MKSKCKLCICSSFSQGDFFVYCEHCSLNIVLHKTCARYFQKRVNLSNDFHTGGDDACFGWRVPFSS